MNIRNTRTSIKGLNYLKKAVWHGNAEACLTMGKLYHTGYYVTKNDKEAVKYFKLANRAGLAMGSLNLALSYLKGQGIEMDKEKGMACYKNAVNIGFGKDLLVYPEAWISWKSLDFNKYVKDLKNGLFYKSQEDFFMALSFYNGTFVYKRDYNLAFLYMKKAAEAGYVDAYKSLACMYEYGMGCAKNLAKAKEWRDK